MTVAPPASNLPMYDNAMANSTCADVSYNCADFAPVSGQSPINADGYQEKHYNLTG